MHGINNVLHGVLLKAARLLLVNGGLPITAPQLQDLLSTAAGSGVDGQDEEQKSIGASLTFLRGRRWLKLLTMEDSGYNRVVGVVFPFVFTFG